MEINIEKQGQSLLIRLNGRLDAAESTPVQEALNGYIRMGEHHLALDMQEVSYVSSAGLRVLLTLYKQLKKIQGNLVVIRASTAVASVLELAGLNALLAEETKIQQIEPSTATTENSALCSGRPIRTGHMQGELYPLASKTPLRVKQVGARSLPESQAGQVARVNFPEGTFGIGIGALSRPEEENTDHRHGEFIAAGGCAAFQPSGATSRPDFLISEKALAPHAQMITGLAAHGDFSHLLRFESNSETGAVPLSKIAVSCLELLQVEVAAFVAVVETSGLVGTRLLQNPLDATDDSFAFPQICDWFAYASDVSFRDTTSLLTGVVARHDSKPPFASQLRPLSLNKAAPLGHVHAAVFPYRPLQKGTIDLKSTVGALFEGGYIQTVIHLLGDTRNLHGAGESLFYQGAIWMAPVANDNCNLQIGLS